MFLIDTYDSALQVILVVKIIFVPLKILLFLLLFVVAVYSLASLYYLLVYNSRVVCAVSPYGTKVENLS